MKMLKRFKNKQGQTAVEYLLIVAVLVTMVVAFGSKFKGLIEGATQSLGDGITGKIKDTMKTQ